MLSISVISISEYTVSALLLVFQPSEKNELSINWRQLFIKNFAPIVGGRASLIDKISAFKISGPVNGHILAKYQGKVQDTARL